MVLALIGIGLAGSGKSTVLKALAKEYGMTYVSRDDIVEARCGNPHDQSFRSEAGVQADWHTLTSCAQGKPVVLDSTFVQKQKRCQKIHLLRTAKAKRIVGIFFDTPLAIAQERNRARQFVVPPRILVRQYKELVAHPPCLEDGFDQLYRADELDTLKRNELG